MIENQPFERTCIDLRGPRLARGTSFARGLTSCWYRRPMWIPIPGGQLFIAIANDQWAGWRILKRIVGLLLEHPQLFRAQPLRNELLARCDRLDCWIPI